MKKLLKYISLLVFTFTFTSCSLNINNEYSNKVVAPINKQIPIEGTWIVSNVIEPVYNVAYQDYSLNKSTFSFNNDYIDIDGETFKTLPNTSHSIKRVSFKNYIDYKFALKLTVEDLAKKFNLSNKLKDDVFIVSFNLEDSLTYDFIKLSDDLLLFYDEGFFYLLNKSSSDNTNPPIKNEKEKDEAKLKDGILLGLKERVDDKNYVNFKYRTFWISSDNIYSNNILSKKDLFVPRKTGFWNLKVNRLLNNTFVQDIIEAYPIDNDTQKPNYIANYSQNLPVNVIRQLNFVGNDYISTSHAMFSTNNENVEPNNYMVIPIDNLATQKGVNISDVFDENVKEYVLRSAQNFIASHPKEKSNYFNDPSEENFCLKRKNGFWIMNFQVEQKNSLYNYSSFKDFDLNFMPSKKLLTYNDLSIPWQNIKTVVPNAIDALTSPSKDFILIFTNDMILAYKITNDKLEKEPISSIPISSNESIIMSEWCSGYYVEKWEKAFLNSGAKNLDIKRNYENH